MNNYKLFIDELGIADPKDTDSAIYVLTGITVKHEFQGNLSTMADHIKYKYWNRTNVIFHSRDIGNNLGEFQIFENSQHQKANFINDLFKYLSLAPITVFTVVVDKNLARSKRWNSLKIISESIRLLYFNFLTFLLGKTNSKGKIVVESASAEKDIYYLKHFAYFTSPKCKEMQVDYKLIQKILTSISFVTKRNYDIEEQIADLFSYAAKCKYINEIKKQKMKPDSYEARIMKIFNSKLFLKPKILKADKLKFYEKVEPFTILPKK